MDCFVEELTHAESEPYNKRPRQTCHGKWNRGSAEEYVRKRPGVVHGKPSTKDKWYANSFNKKELVLVKDDSTEKQFREYADKWYAETVRDSSITRILSNENYLRVIELGTPVVPFILKELQSRPRPWFLVLRILTKHKDIGRGYPGNFEKMAEAWINWGKECGIIK